MREKLYMKAVIRNIIKRYDIGELGTAYLQEKGKSRELIK